MTSTSKTSDRFFGIFSNASFICNIHIQVKVTWHTAKYGDLYSEYVLFIYPSMCAHTHAHTHTHTEQWAAIYAAVPGEQLGVRCLAQGHLSCGIEGRGRAGSSLPTPTIPAGPRLKLATFCLGVWLSIIRPRLSFHNFPFRVQYSC